MREILSVTTADAVVDEVVEADDEDDDIIGCLPRSLASGHRAEIEEIIRNLPQVVRGSKEAIKEVNFDRYVRLLDLYQEQPRLLDGCLPSLLETLLSYVALPTSGSVFEGFDCVSIAALKYLDRLMKVRGSKVVVRLLPHQVTYLEKLISCLEYYQGKPGHKNERYVLLLWLWIICKNPFDMHRFDPSDQQGRTLRRIFDVALPYLNSYLNKTHYATALVISQCLSRKDGLTRIEECIDFCLNGVEKSKENIHGYLILLLAIMKHVDRKALNEHSDRIFGALNKMQLDWASRTPEILQRKMLVKLLQRTSLINLRPVVASWRYRRGKRRLEENLCLTNENDKTGRNGKSIHDINGNGVTDSADLVGDVDNLEDAPSEEVEKALGYLLGALSDNDTSVRWSSAKGVGRICSRLSRNLVNEDEIGLEQLLVVEAIVSSNFDPLAGHCSWHGGCMALAELARRGFLMPENLDKVFPIVEAAIFYEEPMGCHVLGVNVRDAACYMLWAFARAYEPHDLCHFLDKVATGLCWFRSFVETNVEFEDIFQYRKMQTCCALFDREVRLRRAASAALQENVGRQKNFPDGIAILTILDYYAVGNRKRCYHQLSAKVISFSKYADAIIDHLVEKKICHWDEQIRCEAAEALEILAPHNDKRLAQHVDRLLAQTSSPSVFIRHGSVISLAHSLKGLFNNQYDIQKSFLEKVANVPEDLKSHCHKVSASSGGEMSRKAVIEFIDTMSHTNITLSKYQKEAWLSLLERCASDNNEDVRAVSSSAAASFFRAQLATEDCASIVNDARARYIELLVSPCPEQRLRIGAVQMAACLAPQFVTDELFDALCNQVLKPTMHDKTWAYSRRSSVDAVAHLWTTTPAVRRQRRCFDTLFHALSDYTADQRGDVGRLVRESAMKGLASVLSCGLVEQTVIDEFALKAVKAMIKQSAETIQSTRTIASNCLHQLLTNSRVSATAVPDAELLKTVYEPFTKVQTFQDSELSSLSAILRIDCYFEPLLQGLIHSAGGISEGTRKLAMEVILEYHSYIADSYKKWERYLSVLADLFMVGMKKIRVGTRVMRALPVILGQLPMNAQFLDESKAVATILRLLKQMATSRTANPSLIHCALNSLAALLSYEDATTVYNCCLNILCDALGNAVPLVRGAAAQSLYESLCLSETDEEALSLLSETWWQDSTDVEKIENAAREVKRRLIPIQSTA